MREASSVTGGSSAAVAAWKFASALATAFTELGGVGLRHSNILLGRPLMSVSKCTRLRGSSALWRHVGVASTMFPSRHRRLI